MKKYFLPVFIVILLMAILLILFMKQDKSPELTLWQQVKKTVVYELAQISQTTKSMRMDFVHSGLNDAKTEELLQKLYGKLEHKSACLTISNNGEILKVYPATAESTVQKLQQLELEKILQAQDPFLSKAVQISSSETAALLGYPIWDDNNKFSGMMAVLVPISSLLKEYKPIIEQIDNFWITQKEGFMLYASQPQYVGKNLTAEVMPFDNDQFQKVSKAIRNFQQGNAEFVDNDKQLTAYWETMNFKGRIWKFVQVK